MKDLEQIRADFADHWAATWHGSVRAEHEDSANPAARECFVAGWFNGYERGAEVARM